MQLKIQTEHDGKTGLWKWK